MKKPYHVHESWTAWNVSLWVSNDESIYREAVRLKTKYNINRAARILTTVLPDKTPDGAKYSVHALTLALRDLE